MQCLVVYLVPNEFFLTISCGQTDLEEAKGQEIGKLQSALQEMQEKIEEAHAEVVKEKEAAKLAIEQAPPKIVEVPVVDTEKVEQLTSKNKELEVVINRSPRNSTFLFRHKIHNLILQKNSHIHFWIQDELSTFRQKAEDLENKLLEMQKRSDELSQETQEQESKVNQLQEMIERY